MRTKAPEQVIAEAEARALRLLRNSYSLSQVSDQTGLPVARLRELARDFPSSRTSPPQQRAPQSPAGPVAHSGAARRVAPGTARLKVRDLFADESYQRPLNLRRVLGMVRDYDPALLGVLEVSDRGNGRYAVIDGRHRLELALARDENGDDTVVLCNVHVGLSIEDEAALYYKLDSTRRPQGTWDRWKARRACGDEKVIAIEKVIAGVGLRLEAKNGPGVVSSHKQCEQLYQQGGAKLLRDTLSTLVRAFGADSPIDAWAIGGVGLILTTYNPGHLDSEDLVSALSVLTPGQVTARAKALRETVMSPLPRCYAQVVVDLCNLKRPAPQRALPLTEQLALAKGAKAHTRAA